jgi:kynurenine 3-monooxygenase
MQTVLFSRIRHRMQRQACLIIPKNSYPLVIRNIPANVDGTYKLDKNFFHIWSRGEYIGLPWLT